MPTTTDPQPPVQDDGTLGPLELFLYAAGTFLILLGLAGAVAVAMMPPSNIPDATPSVFFLLAWLIGGLGLGGGVIGIAVMLGRLRALLTHSGGLLEQTERNEEFSRLLTGMETMQALLAQSQPPLEPSDEPTDDSPAHAPVESATVSTETGDNSLENQTRLADDLIAASRFDDAVALVEGLLKKFPDHDSTRTLLSRVRHEAQTYHDEQCNRYYELIQEHAQNRNWVSAVQAAHRLIHDFPDSKESAEAQTMMPTLVDNARLQEVRDYREAIRDLLAHGKFADLVSLGETILENYPETALADELRTKLPLWRQQAEGA